MRGLAVFWVVTSGVASHADPGPGDVLARFAGEPSVAALQRAAVRLAEVQPERVRSWQRRVRAAAVVPTVRARVGRGQSGLYVTRGADGLDHVVTETDAWRFEVEATWALDHLVFDPNELRAAREGQRLAMRREELTTEVAQLYFARRRLQVDQALDASASRDVKIERQLAIEELTATLAGLTGVDLAVRSPP